MQVDDPPYLSVGTAVSAKYKGAFCEAKVSRVVRMVKCKVTYKMGLGNATVTDNDIRGTLRVGQLVQAKHPDRKDVVDATITKIQDCSQYTVVFDDGDITTLRRTALCLKSGRHFNESETLDQLPLTHPEHFCNPVVGGRRGRRNRMLKEDSSEEEIEEENEPDLEGYTQDIGRVVSVESAEKKRNKENWFPGLVVIPSAQPTVRINVKDEFLVRSFKDGRYYTVPKKEISEFNRDQAEKVDSPGLSEAVQKAIKFLDDNELPLHWEKSSLFNTSADSDSEDNISDSSDDEPCEEKDRFVAQLYKFMDDSGTPLNKTPTISNKDIDLHRLFKVVQKMGGYNRVTNQNKWRSAASRMRLPHMNQNVFNQVKSVYKKCLVSYEAFHRTLGVTMLNPTRSSKKTLNKGRSLIRDKDRSTPVNSPKPEKEEEIPEKIEEKKEVIEKSEIKPRKKPDPKEEKKSKQSDISDTNSEVFDSDPTPTSSTGRPKRSAEHKIIKYRKTKPVVENKVKAVIEKFEEQVKKEEEEKVQLTRSKSQFNLKVKESVTVVPEKKPEPKLVKELPLVKPVNKQPKKLSSIEEEKKKGRKKLTPEEKSAEGTVTVDPPNIGDKLKVYYGPTNESKVTYEAKVIEVDKDANGSVFKVHYSGWNARYDEWITLARIAENLSATTKAKRLKQNTTNKNAANAKLPAKRGRCLSVSGRSGGSDLPRSTTPSSVTSSSSRTKSPATPCTRSSRSSAKQDSTKNSRRISIQTDASNRSDSESEVSESEPELLPRTRSGSRTEEMEIKTYRRKLVKPPATPKPEKRKYITKEDEDTEKEEESDRSIRRTRRIKKSPEKSTEESDEDGTNPPKGRDFDLNQIRQELKGFTKALKVPPVDTMDKDGSSSDDSTTPPVVEKEEIKIEEAKEKKIIIEKSSSSEDIYEFKEPEPFEFETRPKLVDEKNVKKRLPRLFEELDKSPKKKTIKSPPGRSEKQDSPVPEKKNFRRTPLRKTEDSEEDMDLELIEVKKEDPFDKLVESPSFNIVKCSGDKIPDSKTKPVVRNLLEEPLSLFRELPEAADDNYSRDMELSDCESQTQIFTRNEDLFTSTFSKLSPDRNTMDMEFSSGKTDEGKMTNSDEEDMIRVQIQRAIAQSSSTDDDSNDAVLMTSTTTTYQMKKREETTKVLSIMGITDTTTIIDTTKITKEVVEHTETPIEVIPKKEPSPPAEPEKSIFSIMKQTISPALQETDSSLLESIVSQPPMLLNPKLDETVKELSVKTGTKIADSILQKFSFIKNNIEAKTDKTESVVENVESKEVVKVVKETVKPESSVVEDLPEEKETEPDVKPTLSEKIEPNPTLSEPKAKADMKFKTETPLETKKRRRVISKAYIEESDTDSSDSEQLVIVRSDDDSQTGSLDLKLHAESKESENSNLSLQKILTTDDSLSQPEERNFNFTNLKTEKDTTDLPEETTAAKKEEPLKEETKKEDPPKEEEKEEIEEEEQSPHLHSLLLCEEEIPRSPAPVSEPTIPEPEPKTNKNMLEMPFASAPGTSNSKMLLEPKKAPTPPLVLVPVRENAQAVLENTPPTTPESTISNLSPRGENGGISPNTANSNDSCKSNEVEPDFSMQRRNSLMKVSPYSEEDTQMTSEPVVKKSREESVPASCKKRRRSHRNSEEVPVPVKRGRKPLNRSRHNSDSDDTSEHSTTGSTNVAIYDRSARSPRPSKYNFFVEFDPSLDSGQRIAVLQQKLSELRKTYADVKAELATVERRRKKIRRREREAIKAAKQEMACA